MFEPERKPVYDSRRDKSRFRIETDRMEAVCRQALHMLSPAWGSSYRNHHLQRKHDVHEYVVLLHPYYQVFLLQCFLIVLQ